MSANKLRRGTLNAKSTAEMERALIPEDEREEQKEKPRTKSNKTLRLYNDHNAILAEVAFMRTKEGNGKVSESDIVAEALDDWAEANGIDTSEYR